VDIMKRIAFESKGICNVISRYTGDPYINNVTAQLLIGVGNKDHEAIMYSLKKIQKWYKGNQSRIQANSFVLNKSVHIEMQQNIDQFIEELGNYDPQQIEGEIAVESLGTSGEILFISHSSKDKVCCDAFVNMLESIGVPEDKIIYTSSPRHGVPGDEDIFDYLRSNLESGAMVFYMLSDNYYDSVYCLNEMGAAWIVKNDSSAFLLPNFTKRIDGVIDSNKKAYRLQSPLDLIQFKNKICALYDLSISEEKWEDVKSTFLRTITCE